MVGLLGRKLRFSRLNLSTREPASSIRFRAVALNGSFIAKFGRSSEEKPGKTRSLLALFSAFAGKIIDERVDAHS